jgi:hypothetical protein
LTCDLQSLIEPFPEPIGSNNKLSTVLEPPCHAGVWLEAL